MRIGSRALLRSALGIGISLVAGWLVLRSVDLQAVGAVLERAIPAWIAVMVVAVLVDVAMRAARWQVLLAPIVSVPYRRVLGYTYLGYLANNILPARLGELVRVHALGEGEGVSRTTVLGTVVVERVVDTVMVVGIASLAVVVLSVRGVMSSAVLLGGAFVTLLVIALAVGIAAHRLPGAARVTAFAARWPRLVELARRLRDGLSVAARPRTMAGAVAFSVLAWGASIVVFLAGGQAVGVELTVAQGALIGSGVALATIVPSGPGYLGTFELTAVGIADGFGIDRDTAFAMALLVHASILAVTTVGGVIAVIASRRRGRPMAIDAEPILDEVDASTRSSDVFVAQAGRRLARSNEVMATRVASPMAMAAPSPTAKACGPTARRSVSRIDRPTPARPTRMHQPDSDPRTSASCGPMIPTLRRTVIATKPSTNSGTAFRTPALVSPATPPVRAQAQAIPTSSGAMSALRISFTTVATSSASGENAALAATTWLVSLIAIPDHSPKAGSVIGMACPMTG